MIPIYIGVLLVVTQLALLLREDWRLLFRSRRVRGIVIGHERTIDEGSPVFAARVRFTAETGETVEIIDSAKLATPRPDVGVAVDLIHPLGAPRRARIRRQRTRALIYLSVVVVLLALVGRVLGWLSAEIDIGPARL